MKKNPSEIHPNSKETTSSQRERQKTSGMEKIRSITRAIVGSVAVVLAGGIAGGITVVTLGVLGASVAIKYIVAGAVGAGVFDFAWRKIDPYEENRGIKI